MQLEYVCTCKTSQWQNWYKQLKSQSTSTIKIFPAIFYMNIIHVSKVTRHNNYFKMAVQWHINVKTCNWNMKVKSHGVKTDMSHKKKISDHSNHTFEPVLWIMPLAVAGQLCYHGNGPMTGNEANIEPHFSPLMTCINKTCQFLSDLRPFFPTSKLLILKAVCLINLQIASTPWISMKFLLQMACLTSFH